MADQTSESLRGAYSTRRRPSRILRIMHEAPQQRMHTYDARLADLVFDYMRDRLQLDPVPLDHPGERAKLEEVLSELLGAQGRDPEHVLTVYAEHLAPAVVSCASLQGISWLEAAGAVAAENQVLRLIADLAGMPSGAGGCFVTGGSAGNLSAL